MPKVYNPKMNRRALVWGISLLVSASAFAFVDESSLEISQFSGYKPIYVLAGSPDAKIELSLKARLYRDADFFFSYTQLMLWNLQADSHPFRDLNFNPSLFYRWHAFQGPDRWIDVGYEHESNGLAGPTSREWERLYALVTDTEKIYGSTSLLGVFKAWLPFKLDTENPDLVHYRGLCELSLSLLDPFGELWRGSDITLRFYPGGPSYFDPTLGGQELTLRMKFWQTPWVPKITVQVFHGYGEYLLDYNQSHWRAYAGISF